MSRVAVSGTTGLIGARVAEQLGKTHDVVRLGRRDAPDIRVDFREPADVAHLLLHGISAFIHCAGVVDADFRDDRTGAYVQSTASIAALVDRVLAEGVSRFVYISTAHVYGRFVGRIDETSSPQPISDYAIAHFAAEQIIRRRADSKFIPLILRPCAVFGIPRKLDAFERS
jgi:UDP-glucose 4-epimerase